MLSDVLGQESVISTLTHGGASSQLSQTYLFAGEPQSGKSTVALGLSKVLLCEQRPGGAFESCDSCATCRSIDAGTHPDVRSVAPTGPSRILRIAQLWPRDGVKEHPASRAMLRDLHFSPVSGKRRVFIIESADAMNEDTANSLLKVLEEPPPYALFILTARSSESVLPTILSRSQVLRFSPVAEPEIAAALVNRGIPSERAHVLAAYAQGRPGVALRAAMSASVLEAREELLNVASATSAGGPPIAALKIADNFRKASSKLADLGGDDEEAGARTMIAGGCDVLLLWYRDLLVRQCTNGAGKILNADRSAVIQQQAARYTTNDLEHAIDLIRDSRRYITRNANAQVVTEYLMLNLLALGQQRRHTADSNG